MQSDDGEEQVVVVLYGIFLSKFKAINNSQIVTFLEDGLVDFLEDGGWVGSG